MKSLTAALLFSTSVVLAQRDTTNDFPNYPDLAGVDPALIVNPPEGLDLEGCFSDLVESDIDGSGAIEKDEYLNFINTYGRRICWYQEELTLEQHGAFNSLACICRSQEGNDASCCLLDNAKLYNTNALNPAARTEEELLFMTVACVVTDGTLRHLCTPYVIEKVTPPPVIIPNTDRNFALRDGTEDGSIWALIMGIIGLLLLVCLCCCCCAAGTKNRSREEEEEDENVQVIPPPPIKEAPAEQAPRELDMEDQTPVIAPPGQAEEEEEIIEEEEEEQVPGGDEVEYEETVEEIEEGEESKNRGQNEAGDEDEGEGRRKRGSNYADEEDDDGIPRWGAPRLPPPEPPQPDPLKLRPIPPKEPEEPDEWDQPGREILEPKHKDEMEGQTFDPYNPDGGVQRDDREGKAPGAWKKDWNRGKPEEEDEVDNRKHRIQSGLGEGEVWDKLEQGDDQSKSLVSGGGDVFDWVVQSALGVLDKAEDGQDESSHTDNV
mmetsp:Transcript_3598/g.7175  ORF Transcript_3598/g.7175 Transcript_3598/m.7175 type:complete len:491 (-) Transcript_3598:180-1652(-)|eukprot:scaffold1827_cov167-Amphora_coffeaeformis.AAC.7